MPQTGKSPDNKNITYGSQPAFAAAAQRKVYIFPKPSSQRDMPSTPELRYGSGRIGTVKVLRNPETEHLTQPHCHNGISPEIKIYLEEVRHGSQPGYPRMQIPRAGSHDRIPERTDLVGQQNLKSQP